MSEEEAEALRAVLEGDDDDPAAATHSNWAWAHEDQKEAAATEEVSPEPGLTPRHSSTPHPSAPSTPPQRP